MPDRKRISTLDALRGVASFAVCWFHLTNGNAEFLPEGWLKSSGTYGWAGVEVFFVISGFVIPYALHRSNYELKNYGRFVLKRVVRLDPPYLVAIAVTVALNYLSSALPGYRGEPFQLSLAQLLLHFGYINVFFGYPWLNVAFWTLAIEFQYYLLAGLLFPACASRDKRLLVPLLACAAALPFALPSPSFIFHYEFLFLLGVVTFQYKIEVWGKRTYLALLFTLGVGTFYTLGGLITAVGTVTALAIAFVEIRNKVLGFLGTISYSLYLLHGPVGGRVINLGVRYCHSTGGKIVALILATGVSIAASYLLYKLVEHPSQLWSSAIRYRREKRAEAATGDLVSEAGI
jgi:peptidoglycan/LPS O-acetylase OafA/YrhL